MNPRPPRPGDLPELETERLTVRLGGDADVPAIVRYLRENRDFLRPFEPRRPVAFFEERFWHAQLRQSTLDYHTDRAVRFFLFLRHDPETVVGTANFTRIDRGISHSCTLGYGLAEAEQGKRLMYEALRAAVDFMFDRLNLHRIEANHMPHNRRSGNLLRRLGFVVEGYARDYLQIDGRWEDHVLTSLTNPRWRG